MGIEKNQPSKTWLCMLSKNNYAYGLSGVLVIPTDWHISAQGGRCLSLASSAVAFKSSCLQETESLNA